MGINSPRAEPWVTMLIVNRTCLVQVARTRTAVLDAPRQCVDSILLGEHPSRSIMALRGTVGEPWNKEQQSLDQTERCPGCRSARESSSPLETNHTTGLMNSLVEGKAGYRSFGHDLLQTSLVQLEVVGTITLGW